MFYKNNSDINYNKALNVSKKLLLNKIYKIKMSSIYLLGNDIRHNNC